LSYCPRWDCLRLPSGGWFFPPDLGNGLPE